LSQPLPRDPILEAQRNWERHGWEDVAEPMAAITALMRTQQIFLQRAETVLKPFGLTFARYEMLALLSFARDGELAMNRASALLQVHATSVTNAVDRLEDAGLVARTKHPTDKRTTLISLTRQGRELAAAATLELNAQVFAESGFSDRDISTLIRIFSKFRREAGDFSGDEPAFEQVEG
jgi:DNA-binding MarR family transcriptional regulator